MQVPTELGKRLGMVVKVDVRNMAVPIPSINRRRKDAKMKSQSIGMNTTNLFKRIKDSRI